MMENLSANTGEVSMMNITSDWTRDFVLGCLKHIDHELLAYIEVFNNQDDDSFHQNSLKLVQFQATLLKEPAVSYCDKAYLTSSTQTLHLEVVFKDGSTVPLCSYFGCFRIAGNIGQAGPSCENKSHQNLECGVYRLLLQFGAWTSNNKLSINPQSWNEYLNGIKKGSVKSNQHPIWKFGLNSKFRLAWEGEHLFLLTDPNRVPRCQSPYCLTTMRESSGPVCNKCIKKKT